LRYYFTAEATYEEIVIDGRKLRFTYFEDGTGKCATWLQQAPCWAPSDLTTEEATLARAEVGSLRSLVRRSKVMDLQNTYGDAPSHQRYYPEILHIKRGGAEKQVTYQSFPGAAAMPPPFKKVRERLHQIVRSKFRRPKSAAQEPLVELKAVTSPDGMVTAHWSGEKTLEGTPVEFGVKKLWFTFAGDGARLEFRGRGELHFSDWNFNIFSPDGAYVLLLQDRFGPFHVVSSKNLKPYLQGKADAERTVGANDYPAHAQDPAKVHTLVRWVSNESFEFKGACCGTEMRYTYDISTGKLQLIEAESVP
jgi:hypothetical protein